MFFLACSSTHSIVLKCDSFYNVSLEHLTVLNEEFLSKRDAWDIVIADIDDLSGGTFKLSNNNLDLVYVYFFFLYNKDCFCCNINEYKGRDYYDFRSLLIETEDLCINSLKVGSLVYKIALTRTSLYFIDSGVAYRFKHHCDEATIGELKILSYPLSMQVGNKYISESVCLDDDNLYLSLGLDCVKQFELLSIRIKGVSSNKQKLYWHDDRKMNWIALDKFMTNELVFNED